MPLEVSPTPCPDRPIRCRAEAIGARAASQDHLVDVADVDAELERGGRHDAAQLPGLEPLFDDPAGLAESEP